VIPSANMGACLTICMHTLHVRWIHGFAKPCDPCCMRDRMVLFFARSKMAARDQHDDDDDDDDDGGTARIFASRNRIQRSYGVQTNNRSREEYNSVYVSHLLHIIKSSQREIITNYQPSPLSTTTKIYRLLSETYNCY